MMRYGDKWRRNRRSFYRYFNAHAIMKYRPNQLVEARKLALGWLAKPDDFAEVLRQLVSSRSKHFAYHSSRFCSHMSSSIVGTLFGIDVDVSENDWYIRVAGDILDGIAEAGVPGAFLVDVLPIRESPEKHRVERSFTVPRSQIRSRMVTFCRVSKEGPSLQRTHARIPQSTSGCRDESDGKSIRFETHRDAYMQEIALQYPAYKWEQNAGYPTKLHRDAIKAFGPTEQHRLSFTLLPPRSEMEI